MTDEVKKGAESLGVEIERKFLVKKLPDNLDQYESVDIDQSYIQSEDDELRVRQEGDKFYSTRKSGEGLVREEDQEEISQEEYQKLADSSDRQVKKRRYKIPVEGGTIELDIYGDDLEGHAVAEIEFSDPEAALNFSPPDWLEDEVTGLSEYTNAELAENGWPESEKEVKEYELEEGVKELIEMIEGEIKGSDTPIVVEIAGGSASGKTSAVAKKVKDHFSDRSIIISMDNYYRGNRYMEEQAAQGVELNWDQPEALNIDQLRSDLEKLNAGEEVNIPSYDFSTSTSTSEAIKIVPRQVIIVEGLFALNDSLVSEAKIHAFVDIGVHGRILRRLMRDVVERPGQQPKDIVRYFAEVVEPMHEKYVQSTKKNADIVIKNEYSAEVEAERSGLYESQLKFRTDVKPEVIRMAGAELISRTKQEDIYYNAPDRNLVETGEILRIRNEGGSKILTYKGPKDIAASSRQRPKFEFEIDDETERGLKTIYGEGTRKIIKDRAVYQLHGVIFSLDQVSSLEGDREIEIGHFIEIRGAKDGADDVRVAKVVESLGIDLSEAIKDSYFDLSNELVAQA